MLRGASDDWIIIGSHHDGPWASAVEDASGTALVLAQARYWSQVPERKRPHNLMFLLNSGHMSGGAGLKHFVETNQDFITNDTVVEVHLEHAARMAVGENGRLAPSVERRLWRHSGGKRGGHYVAELRASWPLCFAVEAPRCPLYLAFAGRRTYSSNW